MSIIHPTMHGEPRRKISVRASVPGLLRDCTGGQKHVFVEAATVDEAVDALVQAHPLLRLHLFDEAGRQRRHVLFYLNDVNVAWLEQRELQPGDELRVLQSVSGG